MAMKINKLVTLLDKVAISGTTPITAIFQGAIDFDNFGFQFITTSTGQGAWTVQGSNNYKTQTYDNIVAAGTFDDITGLLNSAPTAVTTASDQYRQMTQYCGKAIQVTFTPTSGAGTVSCYLVAKAIG